MQCPSVERTFCNLLYVYGRGRRRCGGPTVQADRFPLVGNAHRAFRGEKHGRLPCGRATGKHDIIEKIHNKLFQSMQCPSVERTFRNLLYVYGRGRRRCTDPTFGMPGLRLMLTPISGLQNDPCCLLLYPRFRQAFLPRSARRRVFSPRPPKCRRAS